MRASGYARAANDWYVEPRWAVDGLLAVEPVDGIVLDPACGSGNIPKAIIAAGGAAIGSDIIDRGYGEVRDFFDRMEPVTHVVSNPPYGVIEPFVRHALTLTTGKVCVLARLALLEGVRRDAFFQETPLARIWVSRRRVSMPPGGLSIEARGGSVAFAWFVWEHGHIGHQPSAGSEPPPSLRAASRQRRPFAAPTNRITAQGCQAPAPGQIRPPPLPCPEDVARIGGVGGLMGQKWIGGTSGWFSAPDAKRHPPIFFGCPKKLTPPPWARMLKRFHLIHLST
jgi:hypothetical protein